MSEPKKERGRLREFFSLGEVGGYFFRRRDPNRPVNVNLRMMHGVNKLSILIFLMAVVVLIVRRVLD